MSFPEETYTLRLSRSDVGSVLECLNIRASQYRAMAEGVEPCEERYEVDNHEGMEMYEYYMDIFERLNAMV